jgi:hypothetical protein
MSVDPFRLDFAVIGAQKSGSTFLHRCLMEHPQIYMPRREVRYFEDPEFGMSAPHDLARMFCKASPDQKLGVKRPDYLPRPECAARLHEHNPGLKLVAILRNPIERAVSAYFHLIRLGFIPPRELNAGMRSILRGEYAQVHPKATEIVEYGMYGKHLARFSELFPRSQLGVWTDEDLRSNVQGVLDGVCRLLGVSDDINPNALGRRPNEGIFSLPRLRLLQVRNRLVYVYNGDRTKVTLRRSRSLQWTARLAFAAVDRLLMAKVFKANRPTLAADVREQLRLRYDDDLRLAEELLGRSLAMWRTGNSCPDSRDGQGRDARA